MQASRGFAPRSPLRKGLRPLRTRFARLARYRYQDVGILRYQNHRKIHRICGYDEIFNAKSIYSICGDDEKIIENPSYLWIR